MFSKRVTILSGHYGSGKTNIAVNLAFWLKERYDNVTIADIDIVNPYFRAKDNVNELEAAGIRFISSPYANSNVDLPALPQEVYAVTDDHSAKAVMDVGGDDRGALALGRYAPAILEENNYDMLLVINRFRPLTRTPEAVIEVMHEIEHASSLPFTGILNNSNLGYETTADDIISSFDFAREVSSMTGLPIIATCVREDLADSVSAKTDAIFPIKIYTKI